MNPQECIQTSIFSVKIVIIKSYNSFYYGK